MHWYLQRLALYHYPTPTHSPPLMTNANVSLALGEVMMAVMTAADRQTQCAANSPMVHNISNTQNLYAGDVMSA